MNAMSLEQFTNRAVRYEAWRAPFDPRLRQAVQMSSVSIPAGTIVALLSSAGVSFAHNSDFFWGFQVSFASWMGVLALVSPFVMMAALVSAVGGYYLWENTRGLSAGNLFWQRVATGIALWGAINTLAVGIPVLMLALNLLIWIGFIALVILIFMIVLMVLAGGAFLR